MSRKDFEVKTQLTEAEFRCWKEHCEILGLTQTGALREALFEHLLNYQEKVCALAELTGRARRGPARADYRGDNGQEDAA